jgi:ribonuclease P protein component
LRLETLKNRRDFLAAARAGKVVTTGMIVQRRVRRDDETVEPVTRVGYTASKKVGNAVFRNRAKRRLRAVAREVLGMRTDCGTDFVLIARAGATVSRPFDDLRGDLEYALRKLDKPR